MADVITKLQWVITAYGKSRINELLVNPSDRVRISTMSIGSNGTGTPQERETADGTGHLKNLVASGIPIYEKGIDSERENTIYFKAFIDENKCGYNIAELAIYETVNGVDKMFAVGVGEPIVKPDIKYGYLISVDYTLFIESLNLMEVYDQIELDPDNEFLKKTDIDDLYKAILFVEGNMAEQISHNTHQIGLGRAHDLNNLISDTCVKYNSAAISNYYASLASSVQDMDNINGFWSFHYSNNYGAERSIKDFSSWENDFSTNAMPSTYEQSYLGLLSSLNFTSTDFFYEPAIIRAVPSSSIIMLGQQKDYTLAGNMTFLPDTQRWVYNNQTYTEAQVKTNFIEYYTKASLAYTNSQNNAYTASTNLTLSTISNDCPIPSSWTYNEFNDVWKRDNDSTTKTPADFKTDVVNYSGTPENNAKIIIKKAISLGTIGNSCYGPLTWKYVDTSSSGEESGKWVCSDINTTYDIGTFKSKIVSYQNVATNNDEIKVYNYGANVTTTSITITVASTQIQNKCPAPSTWTYNSTNNNWTWVASSSLSIVYSDTDFKTNVINYTGTASNGDTISFTAFALASVVQITFSSKRLDLLQYVTISSTVVAKDSPFTFIASLQHNVKGAVNTILAQSSYFKGKHNFSIIKTANESIKLTLYSTQESKYISFETNANAVPSNVYDLIITYNPNYDASWVMNPSCKIYINGKSCTITKTESGTYEGLQNNLLDTTSYIDDVNKTKIYPINAKVCLIGIIKEELDERTLRCNSLVLNSLAGKNVYYRID